MPLLGALTIAQRGVEDRDFIPEDLMEIGGYGRSEANLRNQKYSGASCFRNSRRMQAKYTAVFPEP